MSIAKLIKSIAFYLLIILAGLIFALFWVSGNDRRIDCQVDSSGLTIPQFDEQLIDFEPCYDKNLTIPFTASAAVDIDGDGVEELFLGGGMNQGDRLYKFVNNRFEDITQSTKWNKATPDKTFGAVSLDLDHDGDNDLLITRQSGVWLYLNHQGQFSEQRLKLGLDAQTVPLSVAVADLNRDGLYDIYVTGYTARKYVKGETIFNQQYGGRSALFINRGDHHFEDITQAAGLDYQHNTFQGVFIGVDADGLEDLVVAHDTGTVRTWKNLGDLRFENMPNPTSNYYSYPMGIAVSDINNDGLPDFFFSNVGSTTPDAIVRGDLRDDQVLNKKWIMFENKGDFVFEDVAEQRKLADYEFSWGAIFEDFNLDGRDDLVVSENYVGFPAHMLPAWRLNGRFMLQNEAGEFAAVGEQAGIENRLYGISPITADFNQDGYPDLVHVNLQGPQKVFISKRGDANYLKIILPNIVESVGAKVQVTLADGQVLHQSFVVGEGLCSDQTHVLSFGLGHQRARKVAVQNLNGSVALEIGDFSKQTLKLTPKPQAASELELIQNTELDVDARSL